MVGNAEVPCKYLNTSVEKSKISVTLSTASGEVVADTVLPSQVAPLRGTVKLFFLDETPAALSVERKRMGDGFEFHRPKLKQVACPNRTKPEKRDVAKKFEERALADHVALRERKGYGTHYDRAAFAFKDNVTRTRGC